MLSLFGVTAVQPLNAWIWLYYVNYGSVLLTVVYGAFMLLAGEDCYADKTANAEEISD